MEDSDDDLLTALELLLTEHADLNKVIDEMEQAPALDQVTLQRFKKHKLLLKDKIEALKSKLYPDIIA